MARALKQDVQAAASNGASFDSVERKVHQTVLTLGKQVVDLFIKLQGHGDRREVVTTEDSVTLYRSHRPTPTSVRSIVGMHRFEQFTYSAGPKKAIGLRPISARLSLPSIPWSYLLQQWTQMLCVDSAYQQAMNHLQVILASDKFSVDTAERINLQMGAAAREYLDDLPQPAPESEGKYLVATSDCKGVPLVKEDAAKMTAFETAQKKPGNRRMATVASVYSIDPNVRTAEDVADALFHEEPDPHDPKPQRPLPANKITTAHMPETIDEVNGREVHISGIHVAMAWIIGQVCQRRRLGQVLLVVMDGQES